MSSIPTSLVDAFLKSSHSHKLTVNRKLEAISDEENCFHKLHLRKTRTVNDLTIELRTTELVCAKKVILAIPKFALSQLRWKPLRFPKVKVALSAMTPTKVNKVFLAFPEAWWLNRVVNATHMISDAPFRQMYDWKSSFVSGHFVMIASYAVDDSTRYLQNINSKGETMSGSTAGPNKVTNRLKHELLHHLAQAFGIDRCELPEPVSAISCFWTGYPFGGGWTRWRAGYNFTDVRKTIQRPSILDDVFIVGSDYASIGKTYWSDSALVSVDQVYEKYFT